MKTKNSGIIFLLLAGLGWSSGGVFLKFINTNAFSTAGLRSFFAFIAMCILLRRFPRFVLKNENGSIDKKSTLYMWLAGVGYALTMIFFVLANKLTTSANAVLLQYTNPLYIILLGPFVLKEKNTKADYIAIFGVFAGMILFFADGLESGNMLGNAFAALSGMTYASVTLFMRKGSKAASEDSFMLSQLITAVVCSPFFFASTKPTALSWLFLFLLGFVQIGLPDIFYAAGLSKVRALTAALFVMVEPLMNPVWVLIFTGEKPTLMCIIGGALILGFIVIREVLNSRKSI